MDDHRKSVLVEARARILWGSPESEVKDWLREQGLPDEEIDRLIRTLIHERAAEVRKLGLGDILVGGVLALLGGAAATLFLDSGPILSRILGLICVGGIYGLWRFSRGVGRLIAGAKARGSLTDM